jgi:hypothetical protein
MEKLDIMARFQHDATKIHPLKESNWPDYKQEAWAAFQSKFGA